MTESEKFSIKKRIRSFRYAFSGIGKFLLSEHNARLHLAATILVLTVSLLLKISRIEMLAIVGMVALVWVAEMFNTCVEKIMDCISQERRNDIQFIKDVAAGAVLIASLAALITGLIIFIPKFL
ncbi:MAG: diacylglycerol kinase family protein [Bacteroidetes bacterium]|nr:diacylglycerol kinase family protein [Bacteroidota bacterium]